MRYALGGNAMLPLDKDAAIEKMLAPRSLSRVTITGPSLRPGGDVQDSHDSTVMGAIGEALQSFARRHPEAIVDEVRWVWLHRDEVEGVPA